jgi:hypothetical protein
MAAIDTRFRLYPAATLAALETSCLVELKQIEALGVSHSINGRNTTFRPAKEIQDDLANIYAAQQYQRSTADAGNAGIVSRFADFSGQPTDRYS